MDHAQRVQTVSELVGWPTGDLKLLEGGLTGKTFGFRKSSDEPVAFVVRILSATEAESFECVTRALAKAGVTPSVVAASSDFLVTEFVHDGKAATLASFGGVASTGGTALEATGHVTGKLHAIPLDAITTGEASAPRDDLAFWLALAEDAGAGLEASLGVEVAKRLRSEVDAAKTSASVYASASASSAATSPISSLISGLVTGHGDLHPGNILLRVDGPAVLVDLEHCGARTAGADLAYFFAVWGDMFWTAGFAPSPTQPYPYPTLAARQSFAAAYITSRRGAGAVATAGEVEELLYEVERSFARTERLRLMIVWALIAKGDPKHMLAGAVSSFLPHLQYSLELLVEASAGAALAEATRADIVRRGLIVMAAERANAAAAAAAAEA